MAILLTLLLSTELALAHKARNAETSYRRHAMKAAAGHERALHALYSRDHQAPFARHGAYHISSLLNYYGIMAELFPKQGNYKDSDARKEIWLEHGRFVSLIEEGKKALIMLRDTTEIDQRQTALELLRQNCKACHDHFRD